MKPAGPLCLVLAASLALPCAAADSGTGTAVFNVTLNGAPVAGLEITLNVANTGKVPLGRTNARGDVTFALDAANLGTARVEVVSESCRPQERVWLVGAGSELPAPPNGCTRRVVGAFSWGDAHVSVDLMGPVAAVPEASTPGPPPPKFGLAIAAVGGVLTIFTLLSKKEVCSVEAFGQSCSNETRTALLVAGLGLTAGGLALWHFGKRRQAVGELVPVPGGVMVRQKVRF